MWGYENSVRPVINANSTILVKFRLTLNQIIDLVSIGEALNSFYVVLCRVTVKYLYYKIFFQTKFGMCKAQGSWHGDNNSQASCQVLCKLKYFKYFSKS